MNREGAMRVVSNQGFTNESLRVEPGWGDRVVFMKRASPKICLGGERERISD